MRRLVLQGALLAMALVPATLVAQTAPLEIPLSFFATEPQPRLPLSLAEPVLEDEGLQGARLGLEDNRTTGRFLKHDYRLSERVVPRGDDPRIAFAEALDAGERLFVAHLPADAILAIAPLAEEAGAVVLSTRAEDDRLRTEQCSAAVFHVAPSRAMKADALAQYLLWKRWRSWLLVYGSHPADALLAEAYRRAAARYGAKIVAEKVFEDTGGARRTDSGHVQVQRQLPVFTQDAPEHDVILAADESDVFAEYLPYNGWLPRPVAGSAGLVPSAWSRVHEQWGGTQLQRRFEAFAGRPMAEGDYNAWTAVRAFGEAVTRTGSADPAELRAYLVSDAFQLGAFKGQALSFRRWNQQMRQPILLVTPRMLVSVSPQDQFLHRRTPLDTLGHDEPESRCRLNPEEAP
ncbi:ABC transporter substrate-binding protein [Geminicoccaceae bacterium 1502E]|nr:ABC transporter substrate-binding protein [Geminicoccaceae bacterium 1502E]